MAEHSASRQASAVAGAWRTLPRIFAVRPIVPLLHLLSFVAFAYFAFHVNQLALFGQEDGNGHRIMANKQYLWDTPTLGLSSEIFESLGDVGVPVNYYLIPEVVLPAMVNGWKVQPVPVYTIHAAAMFLAIYVLFRMLGVGTGVVLTAAWALPLLLFPFFHDGLLYPVISLAPETAWSITIALFMMALFWRIGRSRHAYWEMAVLLLLVLWVTLATFTFIAIVGPVVALFALASMIGANDRRELVVKFGFCAAALAIVYFSGFKDFVLGIFLNTAAAHFGGEMMFPHPDRLNVTSVLFHYRSFGPAGPLLFLLGTAGAVVMAWTGTPRQRMAGAGFLASVFVVMIGGGALLYLTPYSAIAPLYYELYFLPFYAVFAAELVGSVLKPVVGALRTAVGPRWEHWGIAWPQRSTVLLACAVLPWMLVPVVLATRMVPPYHYPPSKPPLVEHLQREIGLQPGRDFRGRVMTITGLTDEAPESWFDMNLNMAQLWRFLGNDMRMHGLWHYGIPTLFEYNPLLSPFFYRVARDFLARPGDPQMRNVMTLRRIDPAILRLFGVRFMITDASLPAPARLVQTQTIKTLAAPLALYEFDGANLGDYSPIETVVARDADSVLALFRSGADLRRVAALEEPLAGPLVAASSARIVAERGKLRLSATSEHTSLMLLPFEYSHCLTLEPASPGGGAPEPRLIRADLLLTGVLFAGRLEATLRYHTGPFHHARCRIADDDDFRRLGVGPTAHP